jgi:hypothetical protein
LPISEGSIFTYNQQAYELLEQFEQKLIVKLLHKRVIHADETGINSNGKNRWLHCVSSPLWTLYYETLPGVAVIVDRFHVAKNYRGCADKARKQVMKVLKETL